MKFDTTATAQDTFWSAFIASNLASSQPEYIFPDDVDMERLDGGKEPERRVDRVLMRGHTATFLHGHSRKRTKYTPSGQGELRVLELDPDGETIWTHEFKGGVNQVVIEPGIPHMLYVPASSEVTTFTIHSSGEGVDDVTWEEAALLERVS